MIDQLFPPSLEGASVLHVGCGEGALCLEAKKRNAGRVVGIDTHGERLAAAAKMARAGDWDIDFLQGSLVDVDKLGTFDYVVCFDIPHRFVDPIQTIHQLIGVTRHKLILEFEDIDLRTTKFAEKRPRQALLGRWRLLFKLLPYALRPGILVVDSHGRFLMTRNWVNNLLRAQRRDIDRIEIIGSDHPHRYFVLVSIRRLAALQIISGPSGVGKSELLRRLKSNDRDLARIFGIEWEDGWRVMMALDLDRGAEVETNKLVLEYNIFRPAIRELESYEDDSSLTIMRVAQERKVDILVCPREVLMTRLLSRGRPKARPRARVQRLIDEYSRLGGYQRLYEQWISYCEANRCDITYLDVSSRTVKPILKEEALELISRDS